jgi:hypothetical protein
MTDANEEEGTEMGAEAPERDDPVPPLRPHVVGVPGVRRLQHPGVQDPRSLIDDAFEAGEREGYAQGYIDGHDDGVSSTLCRIRSRAHELDIRYAEEDNYYNAILDLEELLDKIERGEL